MSDIGQRKVFKILSTVSSPANPPIIDETPQQNIEQNEKSPPHICTAIRTPIKRRRRSNTPSKRGRPRKSSISSRVDKLSSKGIRSKSIKEEEPMEEENEEEEEREEEEEEEVVEDKEDEEYNENSIDRIDYKRRISNKMSNTKIEAPFQLKIKFLLNQTEFLEVIEYYEKIISNIMKKYGLIVSISEGDYYPETVSNIISICGDPIKVKKAVSDMFVNLNNIKPISNLTVVVPIESLSEIIDTLSKLKKRLDYTLTTRYYLGESCITFRGKFHRQMNHLESIEDIIINNKSQYKYNTIRYEELNINEDAILPLPSLITPKLQYIVYSITTCLLSSPRTVLIPRTTNKPSNNSILTKQFYDTSVASITPKQKNKIFKVQPALKSYTNNNNNNNNSTSDSDNDSIDNEIISIKNIKTKKSSKQTNSDRTSLKKRGKKPKSLTTTPTSISTQTNLNITRSGNEVNNITTTSSIQKIKSTITNTTGNNELKSILKEQTSSSVDIFPVTPMPKLPSLIPIPHINENPKPIPIILENNNKNDDSEKDENEEEDKKELKEYDPEAEIEEVSKEKKNEESNTKTSNNSSKSDKGNKIYEESDLFAIFDQPIQSKDNNQSNTSNTNPSNNVEEEDKKRKIMSLFDLTPSYPTRLLPPPEVILIKGTEPEPPRPEKKFEERIDFDEDNMPCKVILIKSSQLPLIIGDEKGSIINHIIGSSGAQIILPQSDEFVDEHYKKIIIKGTGEEIENARNMIVRRL